MKNYRLISLLLSFIANQAYSDICSDAANGNWSDAFKERAVCVANPVAILPDDAVNKMEFLPNTRAAKTFTAFKITDFCKST
ncbi:MAG: hypothetical protein EOP04_12875, partial [Proteobacteria bacterium]